MTSSKFGGALGSTSATPGACLKFLFASSLNGKDS